MQERIELDRFECLVVSKEKQLSGLRRFLGNNEAPDAYAEDEFKRVKLAAGLADAIGWDQSPHRLQTGDLADLDPAVAQAIRDLAGRAETIELAKKLALDPVVLVIGLLARMKTDRNRSAARIACAIFGKRSRSEVDEAAAKLGIQ